jgi:hypothetical protein
MPAAIPPRTMASTRTPRGVSATRCWSRGCTLRHLRRIGLPARPHRHRATLAGELPALSTHATTTVLNLRITARQHRSTSPTTRSTPQLSQVQTTDSDNINPRANRNTKSSRRPTWSPEISGLDYG